MSDRTLKAALFYHKTGFSIIPCIPPTMDEKGKDIKKPRIEWTEFQTRKADDAEITGWWQKWPDSRVGIVTGKISDLTVLDCDSTDAVQIIEEHLPDNFQVPIAISPRGGRHYYFRHCSEIANKANLAKGLDARSEGGFIMAPPSSGLDGKGYSWLEGCGIHQIEVPVINYSLLQFLSHARVASGMPNDNIPLQSITSVTDRYINFDEGARNDSFFHLASRLLHGKTPQEELEQILTLINQKCCENPLSKSELLIIIDSAMKRIVTRERNLHNEIMEWLALQEGYISVTECDRELQIVTKEQKGNRRVIFHRLAKDEKIIKTETSGKYRVPSQDYTVLDGNAIESGKPLDIRLPFWLDQHVEILPGDLIVIAGTPNAGKTAIFLDTVAHNMDIWECWYFSTEMGPGAWARRREKRDPPLEWKFKFVHGFNNYEDIIKPDCMNFIDYVEQNEGEAYKIPGILAKIQRKLRKGVAFVALQKNQGMEWGIGGQQTKAKPALFLTIETDYPRGAKMRIVKAKAFKEYNPNGFCCNFKIIKGINLLETTGWGPE